MSDVEDSLEQKKRDYQMAKRAYGEALTVRAETERLNPSMVKGERVKPSLGQRLKATTEDLIETKHAYDLSRNMFGNDSGAQHESSNLKADLLKAVIASGRTPDQAEELMKRLSPYMLAVDDPTAALLVSRLNNGSSAKETLELIQVLNSLRSNQPQSDIGQLASAMSSALRTGLELAQKNNSTFDPIPFLQEQHRDQMSMQEKHFQQLQELRGQQPRLSDSLMEIKEVSETLGWKSKPESENVTMKRLELDQRKWEKQSEFDSEAKKSKAQSDLIGSITGTLTKALESPVARELGKNVGKRIGVENPLSAAKESAARQQLNNPVTEPTFGLVCRKCNKQSIFSPFALEQIKSSGGRWVCSCGEAYMLRDDRDSVGEPRQ